MEYKTWQNQYKEIITDLGIDEAEDKESASFLQSYLSQYQRTKTIPFIKQLIFNKEVIVFGAGPSLLSKIKKYKTKIKTKTTVAADGATSALLKNMIQPDLIISDLDGYLPDLINANRNGSIIVIHAHGDNKDQIMKNISSFSGFILGSTQVNPQQFPLLFNVGGFTDGDRSVYLADHLQAKTIYLIGFDFDGTIGQYSFAQKKNKVLKQKKLTWCKTLLDRLDNNHIIYL